MSLKALALEADAVVPSVLATPLAVVPDAVARKEGEAVGASVRALRERRRMMLDFGTADGSLMVEYVSSSDERQWNFDPWRGAFTAWGYDMRAAAEDMVNGTRLREAYRPDRALLQVPREASGEVGKDGGGDGSRRSSSVLSFVEGAVGVEMAGGLFVAGLCGEGELQLVDAVRHDFGVGIVETRDRGPAAP